MYKTRKLIPGWRLNDIKKYLPKDYAERMYVAVDKKRFHCGVCSVIYRNEEMVVEEKDALHSLGFPDKQGGNELHTLLYYEWVPNQEKLF